MPPLPKEPGPLFPVLEPGSLVNTGLLSAGLGAALPTPEALEARCAALGPFIAKVAVHPVLRQTPELLLFLETTDDAKWAELAPPWYDSSTIEAAVVDTVNGFLQNLAGTAAEEEADVARLGPPGACACVPLRLRLLARSPRRVSKRQCLPVRPPARRWAR